MISKKNNRFVKTCDDPGDSVVPRALPGLAAAGEREAVGAPAQMQAGHLPPPCLALCHLQL